MFRSLLSLAVATAALAVTLAPTLAAEKNPPRPDPKLLAAIEAAAPDRPIVPPAQPRKVLVYGRVPTHTESVRACFVAMDVLARKTGAFTAVASGDPALFSPETLRQFDAVVMNNTHEKSPMLPENFKDLPAEEQKAAQAREELLKKSLLDFVAQGKGIVGIHGATCVFTWPEYASLIGGLYGGHITDSVWVKAEEPDHPLCRMLEGKSFEIRDEFYIFRAPYSREKQRVLLSLDLGRTPDPGKRPDKDYAVSWVRPYGQGRVFYCSLGHVSQAYCNPVLLRHYLAGIQFAIGDLKGPIQPKATPER